MTQEKYRAQINGCDIDSYSVMSKKCRDCDKKENCVSKKREDLRNYISENPPIVKKLANVGGVTIKEAEEALRKMTEIEM